MSTYLAGKQRFAVELVLNPRHQELYVLWGWHFKGSLDVLSVGPEVLEFLSCAHDGAGILGAEFGKCSIENGYFVIEFDGVDGKPFVEIFAGG